MGGCGSRLRSELTTPASYSNHNSNNRILSPRRPDPYTARKVKSVEEGGVCEEGLKRMETPSGIPGLTYDVKGRPV